MSVALQRLKELCAELGEPKRPDESITEYTLRASADHALLGAIAEVEKAERKAALTAGEELQ